MAVCFAGVLVVVAAVFFFWHSTADTDAWYFKRLDFSRPSVQHRVSAWRGAVQMMRDHPLGVGWNKAIETYDRYYSPPESGAAALYTNDYLMLGTQLGLPNLFCFVAYVALQLGVGKTLKVGRWKLGDGAEKLRISNSEFRIIMACRAGALAMLAEFWFDSGLFKLATAAVFWVLLELGTARGGKVDGGELMVDRPKAA
jgi:O-antigen ligase